MASTLYLDELTLSTRDWYLGLEVTFIIEVGCFDIPCEECSAALNWGLANERESACGSAPSGFNGFGYDDISVSCSDVRTWNKYHTVTQADLDAIAGGREKAVAFISRGLENMCCEGTTVYAVDEPDPCEGVVCDPICVGVDKYSQKCVDGDCVQDALIETNSPECGYDPCDGVVCDPICVGVDKYSQKCVDGVCVQDALIEASSPDCGFDPCDGVDCPDKCYGADLYDEYCSDGDCLAGDMIEANCPDCPGYVPPDPCDGVYCEPTCVGADKYSQKCVDGDCVPNTLIEENCPDCPGYVPPVDPCDGVVCEDICVDFDEYSQVCEEGECVRGVIMEVNSPDCGYVEPPPDCVQGETHVMTCPGGSVITTHNCVGGEWVPTNETCPTDPCAGISCEPECEGYDKYETYCQDGVCVRGVLMEPDSLYCEYVPPESPCDRDETQVRTCENGDEIITHTCVDGQWVETANSCPEDTDGTDMTTYIIIGAALLALYYVLGGRF